MVSWPVFHALWWWCSLHVVIEQNKVRCNWSLFCELLSKTLSSLTLTRQKKSTKPRIAPQIDYYTEELPLCEIPAFILALTCHYRTKGRQLLLSTPIQQFYSDLHLSVFIVLCCQTYYAYQATGCYAYQATGWGQEPSLSYVYYSLTPAYPQQIDQHFANLCKWLYLCLRESGVKEGGGRKKKERGWSVAYATWDLSFFKCHSSEAYYRLV